MKQGPFVHVDELIRLLLTEPLTNSTEGLGDPAADVDKVGTKRKREAGDPEGELPGIAPANDIYRTRQQKRVHT